MNRIYLDNASTTPLDENVLQDMIRVMTNDFGNPSSIHHHGRIARSIVEDARKTVANILRASIGEIFFTSSATESNNMILKNAVLHHGVAHIITSPTEHPCVLNSIQFLKEKNGLAVTYLAVDKYGNPDLDQLQSVLQDTKAKTLVSLMHGNNEIGTMIDLKTVGDICYAAGALFHTDTVQSLGKFDIDVSELNISFLSGSAHKFHGPKGSGFIYMNLDNIIEPWIHGGAQERNMRAGTENIQGIVGLAKALHITNSQRDGHRDLILNLRGHFKKRLTTELDDIQFNGNQEEHYLPHILSVSFPPTDKADMLMFNLDIAGISASSGSACSSGIESDSHVLVAIGHPSKRKTIRFSFSKYNTIQQIDMVVEKLKSLTPVAV